MRCGAKGALDLREWTNPSAREKQACSVKRRKDAADQEQDKKTLPAIGEIPCQFDSDPQKQRLDKAHTANMVLKPPSPASPDAGITVP